MVKHLGMDSVYNAVQYCCWWYWNYFDC